MDVLNIIPSNTSPNVVFNPNGNLSLSGISTPENVEKFYSPIFLWVDSYLKTNPSSTVLRIQIEYLNTSSTRILIQLIRKLVEASSYKNSFTVEWVHEAGDEDIEALGKDIELVCSCKFSFIPIKS